MLLDFFEIPRSMLISSCSPPGASKFHVSIYRSDFILLHMDAKFSSHMLKKVFPVYIFDIMLGNHCQLGWIEDHKGATYLGAFINRVFLDIPSYGLVLPAK